MCRNSYSLQLIGLPEASNFRGNPRVADIYLGEFMRLYRHFAFRDWLTQHPGADEVQVGHLDETDQWWKRYFGDSFESRQRSYFAS